LAVTITEADATEAVEATIVAILKDALIVASAWDSPALEDDAYAQVTEAAVRIIREAERRNIGSI
jgi:hypothetical protein